MGQVTQPNVEAALADFRAYLDQREADMAAAFDRLEDAVARLEERRGVTT